MKSPLLLVIIFSVFVSLLNAHGDIEDIDYEIWDLMDAAVHLFGPGITWYEIFGVDESASTSDIQKSFRKLSLEFHPDKNPSEEASKKFQALAGIAKILRDEQSVEHYKYWLENGVPYWRGRGYYFRKSASIMQYTTRLVRYSQIKSGLKLLEKQREFIAASKNTTLVSKKAKKDMKKRRYSEEKLTEQTFGVFDDANIKQALDWIVLGHDIAPEVAFDLKEWQKMIKEDFGGNEAYFVPPFPSPFTTLVFYPLVKLFARK